MRRTSVILSAALTMLAGDLSCTTSNKGSGPGRVVPDGATSPDQAAIDDRGASYPCGPDTDAGQVSQACDAAAVDTGPDITVVAVDARSAEEVSSTDVGESADVTVADSLAAAERTGGASDAAADGAPPTCSSSGAIVPVPEVRTYSQWTAYCAASANSPAPCTNETFLGQVLSCAPALFTSRTSYGTETLRVASRGPETCKIEFWYEWEGCFAHMVCELPLPLKPWRGLAAANPLLGPSLSSGLEGRCMTVTSCGNGLCTGRPTCTPSQRSAPSCGP